MNVRQALKFMIVSTLAFACMNAIVKYLIHINPHQLVFFRSASCLCFTLGFLLSHKIPIWGNNRKILILRGLAGVTSLTLFFMSIKYLPIGTAVSLRYIAPIFAAVFAVILLREKIWPMQWLFFYFGLCRCICSKRF